jgi:hypothetical protein
MEVDNREWTEMISVSVGWLNWVYISIILDTQGYLGSGVFTVLSGCGIHMAAGVDLVFLVRLHSCIGHN